MEFDTRELTALAADLTAMGPLTTKATRETFADGAKMLRDDWRKSAEETSGDHGRHYPRSITAELKFSTDIVYEVGPDISMKQGSMGPGFEFGSINQEPHLDGQRAADKLGPLLEKAVMIAAEDAFDA